MDNKLEIIEPRAVGRPQIISKEAVLQVLEENGNHLTVREMADALEVHPITIRKRLRELQDEKILVIPARDGYHLFVDEVDNIDDALVVINAVKWSNGLIKAGLQIGTLAGSQLRRAMEAMGEGLSTKQIRRLKKIYSMLSVVFQSIETDREFDGTNPIVKRKKGG
jgi:DNA-binding transcriptional regulator YhcF (GntR family)